MGDAVLVRWIPTPLRSTQRDLTAEPGSTLRECVALCGCAHTAGISVAVAGSRVEPELWDSTRPDPASVVTVVRVPTDPGSIAALVQTAIQAANIVADLHAAYVGLRSLRDALIPPPESREDPRAVGKRASPAGERNDQRRYETIPQVLGEHKAFPDVVNSYTTVEGRDLYQVSLFSFGHGPLDIRDLKIGEDPLFKADTVMSYTGKMQSNSGHFEDLELELRQGRTTDAAITLYADDVQEIAVNQRLRKGRGWVRHRTLPGTTRITVLVGFPDGLVWVRDTGGFKSRTVRTKIRYRPSDHEGDGGWTTVPLLKTTGKNRNARYVKSAWEVTSGEYDVELRRVTEAGGLGIVDKTVWSSMLNERAGAPVLEEEQCLVSMRAKLTDQFAGIVDDLSAVATTVCLDWDSATATWIERATKSPASLYRHVLQGRAQEDALADSRIHLDQLQDWHDLCVAEGLTYGTVLRDSRQTYDVLRSIAATGRAAFARQDGKYGVVLDTKVGSASPVQTFTPRNTTSLSVVRRLPELPHALKVQWIDPESDWQPAERVVYADGYTEATAEKFEVLSTEGPIDPDHAHVLGRYHLAQMVLRPEDVTVGTDVESADLLRGDSVRIAHDVLLVGTSQGRVKSVTRNAGGDALGVVLDEICLMSAGKTYTIRFRTGAGSSLLVSVVTAAGEPKSLTFTTPILAAAPQPEDGNLFAFGESGKETSLMKVKSIVPGKDHGSAVVLVHAADAIHDAVNGPIPKWDPQITLPPGKARRGRPRAPRISSIDAVVNSSRPGRRGKRRTGLRIQFSPQRGTG